MKFIRLNLSPGILGILSVVLVLVSAIAAMPSPPKLLTDPFLQLPTTDSVRVVWFTEFAGDRHTVNYGTDFKRTVTATTTRLSRTREDQDSKQLNTRYTKLTNRPIWRHEAEVKGLLPNQRLPYRVTSVRAGATVSSDVFTLAAKPTTGRPLKILLTSDHQLKPMAAANLQKVVETVGQVDAVFFAGDLVNIPDRASEWFDHQQGGAFFPVLQGRAHYQLEKNGVQTRYRGGAVIQHAPLYAALGNHEVMGRFSSDTSLDAQFNDAVPRAVAKAHYEKNGRTVNPTNSQALREAWLKNQSFNTDTYAEILSLPKNSQGSEAYYAETFGDVRLIVLYITNIWRVPFLSADARGKYRERDQDLNDPLKWGYGQHIFEAIAKGSPQYTWLEQELKRPEFQQAKYKVVMFHHPPHSLGENSVPAYTDPVPVIERDDKGNLRSMRYEYPLQADYIVRDVVPLLEKAGTHLIFYGHSHLWNRFVSSGRMHFLETSNVGNSYGAYMGNLKRNVPTNFKEDYAAVGDPNGLEPVMPNIAPLQGDDGKPLPYIASNDITAFSIFDTGTGMISSYYFDTRKPESAVVKFDEFKVIVEK